MARTKPAAQPAKPTVKPTPEKKRKAGRVVFDLVGDKNPEVYPFKEAMPEGFNFKVNRGLRKRDFTADHLFFEYRALEMDAKAIIFRAQAEEAKKIGSSADRNRLKRVIKLQEKMNELKEQLSAQGIDVDKLLADMTDDTADAAAAE